MKSIVLNSQRLQLVWARDRSVYGRPTGARRACSLEGCRGEQICVRWSDSQCTWLCTDGMTFSAAGRTARIGYPEEWAAFKENRRGKMHES
jgi:hypothetical protein